MKTLKRIAVHFAFALVSIQACAQTIANFSGTLTQESQVATHAFTTSANGDLFISVTTGPDLNLHGAVMLLDSDGTTSLHTTTQGPGTTVTHHVTALRAGSYSLRLIKDGRDFYFGGYTATVTLRTCQLPDAAGNNSTKEKALLLPFNTTISGHLGFRGQQLEPRRFAWFRVDLPYDGTLQFDVTQSGGGDSPVRETDGNFNFDPDARGFQVLDTDGSSVMYASFPGTNTSTHNITPLRAGTYYVQLILDGRTWYYWGSYTLRATAIPTEATGYTKASDNFSIENAWTLPAQENVTGLLAYRGQMREPDSTAWFRVSMPKDGTLSVFLGYSSTGDPQVRPTDGDLNLYWGLSLLNADGTTVLATQQPSSALVTQYDFPDLKAGTYLIRLTNDGRYWYYWGSYTLRWDAIPDPLPLVFTFGAPSYLVNQTSGSIRIPVSYTGTPQGSNVWVEYNTEDKTAISGTHYTGTGSTTLDFASGKKKAYIMIPIQYSGSRKNKSFTVNLASTSEGIVGSPASTVVKINKQAGSPAIVFKTKSLKTGSRAVQGSVENVPLKDIRKITISNGPNSFKVIGKSPWKTEQLQFTAPGLYKFTATVTLRNSMKITKSVKITVNPS
jgi:hypothetical protein